MRQLTPDDGFPGLRYILLHSFAHALMRQLAIACGYSAASIRERIYARDPSDADGPMAGVLLYTAATDSEGTLGGLVAQGDTRHLAHHLCQALEGIELCSSDPLCAEHHPWSENATLHGAACHACLFVPETSCERGNKYLDRFLLTQTLGDEGAPFFTDIEIPTVIRTDAAISEELILPDFLTESSDGIPVYEIDEVAGDQNAEPVAVCKVAFDDPPAQAFVTRLDASTLEAQTLKDGVSPLAAGSWVLLTRTQADDFDQQTPQLLVRKDGHFDATGRTWTVGYPSLRTTSDTGAQLHVKYVSARPECRPENTRAADTASIGRLVQVYHAGGWRQI